MQGFLVGLLFWICLLLLVAGTAASLGFRFGLIPLMASLLHLCRKFKLFWSVTLWNLFVRRAPVEENVRPAMLTWCRTGQTPKGRFHKLGGSFCWCPSNKSPTIWGSRLGPPCLLETPSQKLLQRRREDCMWVHACSVTSSVYHEHEACI